MSNNKIGEYFEIHFLKGSAVSLNGYGFMSPTANCAILRNCNVSCVSTNLPTLVAYEIDNDKLCPNAGTSSCIKCTSNEKKAFEVSKRNIQCTDIRFTITGGTSLSKTYYDFSLAGIELFGKFGLISLLDMKTCLCYNSFKIACVFIYCFINSSEI